jgi:hypothetical protein
LPGLKLELVTGMKDGYNLFSKPGKSSTLITHCRKKKVKVITLDPNPERLVGDSCPTVTPLLFPHWVRVRVWINKLIYRDHCK